MLQVTNKNKIYFLGKFPEILLQLKDLSQKFIYVKDLLDSETSEMEP
jgi:hypothetical protein